ncbi:50S ribosomal protein bL37 [Streptacidiphilus sp. MAP12-20]
MSKRTRKRAWRRRKANHGKRPNCR